MLKDKNRSFKPKQKFALTLKSNGICQLCNKNIDINDVHFNHNVPWADGGATDVLNGDLYCAKCNLKNGKNLPGLKNIKLRKWQKVFLIQFMEKLYAKK